MQINNNRNNEDFAFLNSRCWSGIMVGTDGYPTKDEQYGCYCIAGGDYSWNFKATAIEFYGVKTHI